MKKEIRIKGMHCAHCAARVEKALGGENVTCTVSLEKATAVVDGDDRMLADDRLRGSIEDLGFDVESITVL